VLAEPPPEPIRSKPTGNPNRDLLRLISDHHASVILMTHAIAETAESAAAGAEARMLEEEHDHELEQVAASLQGRFHASYLGQASVESRFVAGSVRSRPSEDHAEIFALNTIRAESSLVAAIDELLPKVSDAPTRELAVGISHNHRRALARLKKVFKKFLVR